MRADQLDTAGRSLIRPADAAGLDAAISALSSGRLVGLPTETVYGLAGNALDRGAVARIFAAKGRPADNPLIVHIAAAEQLDAVAARSTPLARALAAAFWPGPLTLVVEADARIPAITRGGLGTVAVRVPDHPVAATLLERFAQPVAAPSANRSGRPSPTRAEHVAEELAGAVDVVLDGGACAVGVESTVVDVRGATPVVLREGAVTREHLGVDAAEQRAETQASPGTRYRHYAPRCPVELVTPEALPAMLAELRPAERARTGLIAPPQVAAACSGGAVTIATYHDGADLARQLYGALRAAEQAGVDRLVVQTVDEDGVGRAVMDRLRRAAAA